MKYLIGLFGVLFLLAGCATTPKDTSSVVTLQNKRVIDGTTTHSFMFEKIDGVTLKVGVFSTPSQAAHYINPGNHLIETKVTYHSDKSEVVWASEFEFYSTLVAGEVYSLDASERNWCIKMKLINSNGQVIAGPLYSIMSPFLSLTHMKKSWVMSDVKNKINNASCNPWQD